MKSVLSLCLFSILLGQNTDIYIFDFASDGLRYNFSNQKNITNRDGYNNQPSFSKDGSTLFYASDHGEGINDIYAYYFASGVEERLTQSLEKEYSPLMTPDGKHISFIQMHGRIQQLVKMNLETKKIENIGTGLTHVGYHCWLTESKLALFELPKPFTLQVYDIIEDDKEEMDENIGRSLYVNPINNRLTYILYDSDKEKGVISELEEFDDDDKEEIIELKRASHDFFIMQDGTILSTSGSSIFKFKQGVDSNWVLIFNGKSKGMTDLSRIAVNPDMTKIAIVAKRKVK